MPRLTGPIPDHILRLMAQKDRPAGNAGLTLAEAFARESRRNEATLQRNIVGLLAQRGITVNWSATHKRKTDKIGWPDLTFAVKAKGTRWAAPVALEVKLPGRHPEPHQQRVLDALAAQGWVTGVVRSEREALDLVDHITKTKGNETT